MQTAASETSFRMEALTNDQIARFERDGFLNARPVLSEEEVETLSADLDRILEIGPVGSPADSFYRPEP